jgi:polyhydroxyalkanoate synthesis repressor PhaR
MGTTCISDCIQRPFARQAVFMQMHKYLCERRKTLDAPAASSDHGRMPEPGPGNRLEIRKYPNRRYYDTTRSRHVTLEQIHALIRDGHEVRVVDSKTDQDITAKILAQIIIEMDAPKLGVFPVTMLHRLLQSNQDLVTQFVQKYFNQPLMAFMDAPRSTGPGMADWTRMMWGPLNPSFWSSDRPSTAGPDGTSAPRGDQQEMRQQIESLRKQVADLKGPKRGRKAGGRRRKPGAR